MKQLLELAEFCKTQELQASESLLQLVKREEVSDLLTFELTWLGIEDKDDG